MREMNWLWRIGAPLVRGILSVVFTIRVIGLEHVPPTGPAILACNHISVLDGPFLASVTGAGGRRETSFLIAAEVFDHPLLGSILRAAHQIPIRRGHSDDGALDDAVAAVMRGDCVGIFPEGRVADDASAGMQRIRSGVARIALPSGAQVIPVGIWGTQAVWPRERRHWGRLLHRPQVALVYGDRIAVEETPNDPDALRNQVRAAIELQIGRARVLAGDPA